MSVSRNDPTGRYRRALSVASATTFVGVWLWAPFALVLRAAEATRLYALTNRVAMVLACQSATDWPSGSIDKCGAPW